jgi:hypothetical protein
MKRKLKTVTRRLEKADKLLAAMKAVAEAVCDCLAGSLCVALRTSSRACVRWQDAASSPTRSVGPRSNHRRKR